MDIALSIMNIKLVLLYSLRISKRNNHLKYILLILSKCYIVK